jgi:hypothetical protein
MIRYEKVSKSYDQGATQAVRDVTFSVHDGKTMVLLGDVRLREDDPAQDDQPANRRDLRLDPNRR